MLKGTLGGFGCVRMSRIQFINPHAGIYYLIMKKASQSAIQTPTTFAAYKEHPRLRKLNTLIPTDIVICEQDENESFCRREKATILSKSIEFKIKKAKEICELAKQKSINCKTSRKNIETSNNITPSVPIQLVPANLPQNLPKLTLIHQNTAPAAPTASLLKDPWNTECSFSMEKYQKFAMDDKKIQSLHEVRLIESFIADEDEEAEMSFVQEHGTGILDWGVCLGKASEFRILRFLNNEKYGKVYLAQSHRNGVVYSIKAVYRSLMDETRVHKIVKEVEIQSFLDHPNIVKLYNFFVDDDSAYLVMEPCLGRNLHEALRDVGRVPEKTVIEWARQILNAMQCIHKNGVVHRNLKLENILLHEMMIKICDFGSSIHTPLLKETQSSLQTQSSSQNSPPVDFKTDIWSIGRLVYQLLFGIIPEEVSTKDCIMKIVEFNLNFAQEITVSESAKDFITCCMQKDPKERSTARELMDHQFLNQVERFRWTIM